MSTVCFQQKASTTGEPPARSATSPRADAIAPSTLTATNRPAEPEKQDKPLSSSAPVTAGSQVVPHVTSSAAVFDDSHTTLGASSAPPVPVAVVGHAQAPAPGATSALSSSASQDGIGSEEATSVSTTTVRGVQKTPRCFR